MKWSSGTFNYEMPNQIDRISIDIDTTQFNHCAFEYVGNKLTVWVNGKSTKSHNVNFGDLSSISMNVDQLGVLFFMTVNSANQKSQNISLNIKLRTLEKMKY